MKYLLVGCFLIAVGGNGFAQIPVVNVRVRDSTASKLLSDFNRSFILEEKSDTTANVSFGDFDGDGHLDILLVKGRHWPIIDRILLGDGLGRIRKAYNLGKVSDRKSTRLN